MRRWHACDLSSTQGTVLKGNKRQVARAQRQELHGRETLQRALWQQWYQSFGVVSHSSSSQNNRPGAVSKITQLCVREIREGQTIEGLGGALES